MTEQLFGEPERRIAAFAAEFRWEDIPAAVQHQAKRSIFNIFATSFSGCQEPAIAKALAVISPFSAAGDVSIVGRGERRDAALAAFVNAMAANVFDYDDNHPTTIIHPTAPVSPALFAFAEATPRSGVDVLKAFVIGAEIECRIGKAMSPYHYAHGWHITSTCGIFGASIGVGVLLGLNPAQFNWAIANAAVQAAGLVEALGTMSKSISVGNAARQGMMSALLAAQDFSGPAAPLTGERGYLNVCCDAPKWDELTKRLGELWEIGENTYKPYPAGVVLNPVIDASLEIASRPGFDPHAVAAVTLTGHPLLRQRTDRADVASGRESQVSAQHAIAIAFLRRQAGLDEFSDAAVAETMRHGRPDIVFIDDASFDIAAVHMSVRMRDGAIHDTDIAAARGSPANPLTDVELEQKLAMLSERAGFPHDIGPLVEGLWMLDTAPDAGVVSRRAALTAA
jgi:2-methylcitrate dehydratase PrpD